MALTFILITVFIDMLGLGILIPVIPFVVREFSASAFSVGLLSMSFAIFQFIATPILGAREHHPDGGDHEPRYPGEADIRSPDPHPAT